MADKIYINTERPASEAVVKSENRPTQPALLPSFVEGGVKDVELYLVTNAGTFDARSGDAGVAVKVSVGSRDATPKRGTFTLTDTGAAVTSAIDYGASAQTIEDALNALNGGAGSDSVLVDVTKQSDELYTVVNRTVGAATAISGASVDLSPESSVTPSISVTGDASTRAQQIIEIKRQPAIYTSTWATVTNGFSGTLSANNARVAQSIQANPNQPFIFEVSIDNDVVCQVPCEVKEAVTPPSAYPANDMPTALDEFAADPSSNASFDAAEWKSDLAVAAADITDATADGIALMTSADANPFTDADEALLDSATQPGDDADTLGSGAATDGQILTADGVGGAAWEDPAGGAGDMTKAVYDPTTVEGDAFDMDNMAESATKKILTATERAEIAANTAKLTANTANVDAAGAVMESDFTPAFSLLVQQSGTGTPAPLTVAADTILGRVTGGASEIDDLTPAQVRTLLNIEDGADVTDETNVTAALDGATLTDVGTPASTDRILLQDASDSNNLKYADFSEFSGAGGATLATLIEAISITSSGDSVVSLDYFQQAVHAMQLQQSVKMYRWIDSATEVTSGSASVQAASAQRVMQMATGSTAGSYCYKLWGTNNSAIEYGLRYTHTGTDVPNSRSINGAGFSMAFQIESSTFTNGELVFRLAAPTSGRPSDHDTASFGFTLRGTSLYITHNLNGSSHTEVDTGVTITAGYSSRTNVTVIEEGTNLHWWLEGDAVANGTINHGGSFSGTGTSSTAVELIENGTGGTSYTVNIDDVSVYRP